MLENKWFWAGFYVFSVVMANFFVAYFGIVKMFGLVFPAGAVWIGITFSARDFVQRHFGHVNVWYFMILTMVLTVCMGIVLTHLPIPLWKIALASGAAFIVSEALDWAVFYFMKKDIIWRIVVSNLISTPVDSLLFVGIAFGGWSFLNPPVYGQAIIKYVSGLIVIPLILYYRRKRLLNSEIEHNVKVK